MRTDRRSADRRKIKAPMSVDRRKHTDRRDGTDRRGTDRVFLELWMEEISGDDVYFRRSGNVSRGGVFFDNAIPHAVGTMVTLKFALPGEKEMVVARGKVVRAGQGGQGGQGHGLGMGVKFVSVEGNGKQRIQSYLRSA